MAVMSLERLAEIDRAIEALGTPASQVRVDGGLNLPEVDRQLDELAQGLRLPTTSTASSKAGANTTTSGVDTTMSAVDATTESSPSEVVADASPSPAHGLDADDLFDDVQGGDASVPLDLESSKSATVESPEPMIGDAGLALEDSELAYDLEAALEGDDEDEDEATGLFSAEDIEAIRRSSAPPPNAEPFDDEALLTPALPSTPPPPPVDALATSSQASQPTAEEFDKDLDALLDDDFELMIEEDLESEAVEESSGADDDPTFIGSVADFQAQLANDEAAPTNAETDTGNTQENHIVEDGDNDGNEDEEKKGFFKKLFG